MNHSQKLVIKPFESEPPVLPIATDDAVQFSSGANSTPKRQPQKHGHPMLEKITKQLKIILKIAKVDGYDLDLRIKDEAGRPVYNSNIISLLNDATSMSKVLVGYDAFVQLLYKANVDPEWITNENVKTRLMRLYETEPPGGSPPSRPPSPRPPSPPGPSSTPTPSISSIEKRKREPDLEEEDSEDEWDEKVLPAYKKRTSSSSWIYPDNETNGEQGKSP